MQKKKRNPENRFIMKKETMKKEVFLFEKCFPRDRFEFFGVAGGSQGSEHNGPIISIDSFKIGVMPCKLEEVEDFESMRKRCKLITDILNGSDEAKKINLKNVKFSYDSKDEEVKINSDSFFILMMSEDYLRSRFPYVFFGSATTPRSVKTSLGHYIAGKLNNALNKNL